MPVFPPTEVSIVHVGAAGAVDDAADAADVAAAGGGVEGATMVVVGVGQSFAVGCHGLARVVNICKA